MNNAWHLIKNNLPCLGVWYLWARNNFMLIQIKNDILLQYNETYDGRGEAVMV